MKPGPEAVWIAYGGLTGPWHPWILIPAWLDEALHEHGVDHHHRPEETP